MQTQEVTQQTLEVVPITAEDETDEAHVEESFHASIVARSQEDRVETTIHLALFSDTVTFRSAFIISRFFLCLRISLFRV